MEPVPPPWYVRPWPRQAGSHPLAGSVLRGISGAAFLGLAIMSDGAVRRVGFLVVGLITLYLGLTGLAASAWQKRHPAG